MKSLQEFKYNLTEEEKQDYQKFDTLVRAGLANKSQITRLHKILGKMGEDRPVFNPQDRQLMQDLFNKMVDLVTNNKQIFQQTRRAVREETVEEGILDTSDYKVGPSGRKVKAHRIKVGDSAYGKEPKEVDEEFEINEEETLKGDPPFTLVLKRKAIRLYPNDTKIALYYNDRLKKYFSIPYSDKESIDAPITAEETITEDVVKHLQNIKDKHQMSRIKHRDGTSSNIDVQTAHAILTVHKALNDDNKKKLSDMMSKSKHHMSKVADFAWKNVK